MKLTPITELTHTGIGISTLREWCEDGEVHAEKIDGAWYIDLVAMLRRNGLDDIADRIELGDSEK